VLLRFCSAISAALFVFTLSVIAVFPWQRAIPSPHELGIRVW